MDRWQVRFTQRRGRAFCDIFEAETRRLIYRLPPYLVNEAYLIARLHNQRADLMPGR